MDENKFPIGTEKAVCEDIKQRQVFGYKKYGMTVEDNPLTLKQWLRHAYEETLDQAIYLKRAMSCIDLPVALPVPEKPMRYFLFHWKTGEGEGGSICLSSGDGFPALFEINELINKRHGIDGNLIIISWNEFKNKRDYDNFARKKNDDDT